MKYTSIFALTLLAALPAQAQNDTSWVASTGLDTNTCIRTAPCKTFQHAHDVTNPGGVVNALDSAAYSVFTISKAITIQGSGVGTEIEAGGGTGISVTTGPVTIRNLTIHTTGFGKGIAASADIHVENVTITGTSNYGMTTGPGNLTAKNLTVTGATIAGILIETGPASIRDSVVKGNGSGIQVQGNPGSPPSVALIERTELSFNTTGLLADNSTTGGGATARISDSVITGNTTGVSAINGGQIVSFRTNMLAGNTTDGAIPFSISLK